MKFKYSVFIGLSTLLPSSKGQSIEVYSNPGGPKDYIKMTKHPGKTDLTGIAVCLRLRL